MEIDVKDSRLQVLSTTKDEILVSFSGKVDGDHLTIKASLTKRYLVRQSTGEFRGPNGKRVLVVKEV